MSKIVWGILICLIIALGSRTLYAADVYITARGKFYHLAGCPKLKDKKVTVLEELSAKAKNIRPCPICFKTKN